MGCLPCVLDTSALIECLTGSDLGHRMALEWPQLSDCFLPTIVLLELSKWLLREAGEQKHDELLHHTHRCQLVLLDRTIALMAGELHSHFRLPTADAIVYATARRVGARVITCDKHFEGLPFVTYYDKRTATG